MNDDAVGVAAECTIDCGKGERCIRRKLETGIDKMLARAFLEVVPTVEDFAHSSREHGTAPPIELHSPCALVSDNRRAEIWSRQIGGRRYRAFDHVVNRGGDRLKRKAGPVEIWHGSCPTVDVFMGAPTPNVPNSGRANAVFLCERNPALWIKSALENTKNVSRREAVMS